MKPKASPEPRRPSETILGRLYLPQSAGDPAASLFTGEPIGRRDYSPSEAANPPRDSSVGRGVAGSMGATACSVEGIPIGTTDAESGEEEIWA